MILLINKGLNFEPAIWVFLPVHIELMIFGWIIQFTLGVAYWMLPRFLEGEPRGQTFLAYTMVFVFNLGIWLLIIAELTDVSDTLRLLARSLELVGVLLFAGLHWKRVVTYNKKGKH
jgi:drug/metabolite transporter superfamily protein YnfA|tara:strand:- start:641 stop:991 length:351 start_codon:yes stop_codon:yes gene_type:complete